MPVGKTRNSQVPLAGAPFWHAQHHFVAVVSQSDTLLGDALRLCMRRSASRDEGRTGDVFPLPGPRRRVRLNTDARPSLAVVVLETVVLMVAALNVLHSGRRTALIGTWPPTAAQRRVHSRLYAFATPFLATGSAGSEKEIQSYLLHHFSYGERAPVLPLGLRGGVPEQAGGCDLAEQLGVEYAELAQQVLDPTALLMPRVKWPKTLKRPFRLLDRSYPSLCVKMLRSGMHVMRPRRSLARFKSKPIVAGGFCVPKDDIEDRTITPLSVNDLVDAAKLPRPRFGWVPALRTLTLMRPKARLLVSKRDARHYFHALRLGKKWHRWLATPAPGPDEGGRTRHPCCATLPMGFAPSAGWAQALTDTTVGRAELPTEQRLHPDRPTPEFPPIWGAIEDDVWCIDEEAPDGTLQGPGWLDRVGVFWQQSGVEMNGKKTVNAAPGAEVQGYFVHPERRWVGVSLPKRRMLLQATAQLLEARHPLVAEVDRVVGKHSFVHSARTPLRSIFERIYPWLNRLRRNRVRFAYGWPVTCWHEVAMAASLLPVAQFSLDSEWSTRVECTDASMSGLGRAWAHWPASTVRQVARLVEGRGCYTNLSLPFAVPMDERGACPLQKVDLPLRGTFWRELSTPWRPSHITLGEAAAVNWATGDRLKTLSDGDKRALNPVDSAATTGAMTKGRSSSRRLNFYCQRQAAFVIGGGLEMWYPWVSTHVNPADRPSRIFEKARRLDDARRREQPEGQKTQKAPDVPTGWVAGDKVVVVCGLLDTNGFEEVLRELAARRGYAVSVVAFGGGGHTLADDDGWDMALAWLRSGRAAGVVVFPPTRTFGRRRQGDSLRPLRARDDPWKCVLDRTKKDKDDCDVASFIIARMLFLVKIAMHRKIYYSITFPRDPGPPYSTLWCPEFMNDLNRVTESGHMNIIPSMEPERYQSNTMMVSIIAIDIHRRCSQHPAHHDDYVNRQQFSRVLSGTNVGPRVLLAIAHGLTELLTPDHVVTSSSHALAFGARAGTPIFADKFDSPFAGAVRRRLALARKLC